MISFFRRALSSWLVLGLLGLILIAFVVTGVSTRGMLGSESAGPGERVTSGDVVLTAPDVARKIGLQMDQIRRQDPSFDVAGFVASGGVERTVGELIDAGALEVFGRKAGLTASRRMVDGEIASAPAFQDLTGKFDQNLFQAFLQRQRVSERGIRQDIEGDLIRRQLVAPITAEVRVPLGVAERYAALLLERREGSIALVPAAAIPAGAAPSEPELQAYYRANILRYTLPERRVLRYALFGRDQLAASVQPSEADVQRFYAANPASYAPKETRSFTQVVLPSEEAARAVAAKVKAGQSFAAAAGNDAVGLSFKSEAELADLSSATVAAAAFKLPKGGTGDPIKSDFGWHVVHVDDIRSTPGKPLAQVRGEITASLVKQRTDEALAKLVADLEDQISDGATFDDVAKAKALTVVTTPPLAPDGTVPGQPLAARPGPEKLLMKDAAQMTAEDDPVVDTIGAGQSYALMQVAQVIGAAAEPFASVRDRVQADLLTSRGADRARAIANALVAKVNAGTPLAAAAAGAGVKLPPVQKAGGTRAQLSQAGDKVPPPLKLMFSMARGKARLLAAPNNAGWYVVTVDQVVPGNPASAPGIIQATRSQFVQLYQQELTQQFANAARSTLTIHEDDRVIGRLKGQVSGATSSQ